MSPPQPSGVDTVEILNSIPVEELHDELDALIHDPEWESPSLIEVTPGVTVQIVRLAGFEGVTASVEVLMRSDLVETAPLVTMGEAAARIAEESMNMLGEVPEGMKEAAANLTTRGAEVPSAAPVCAFIQGVLAGFPDSEYWVTGSEGSTRPVAFNYVFDVSPDGVVSQDPSMPYDQGRVNPFDVEAHVFATGISTAYSAEDMPDEVLQQHWEQKQENTVQDSLNAPTAAETDTDVGDVFYNTNTDEYCWVIAFDSVLGAILQYEDGTFWDEQLRQNGVPAGPYEDRELPEEYDRPIPDPDNPCDVGDHSFGVETPHSFHDFDPGICEECGLAVGSLIELYGQWPLDHVEFECIGCGSNGPGHELIDSERLDETALCAECWDPALTAQENYEKHADGA